MSEDNSIYTTTCTFLGKPLEYWIELDHKAKELMIDKMFLDLKADNARLRAALEKYANPATYTDNNIAYLLSDAGQCARDALKGSD